MPDRDDKSRPSPPDDVAMDSVAQIADWARKYQNHIVVAVCLIVLLVFGKRWYDTQRAAKDASAWASLATSVSVAQLEKASEQYADTAAGTFLRFEYGHALEEDGKLDDAKRVYDELQRGPGKEGLAANLARARLHDLREDEVFAKQLPGKLAELAKNAPPALPVQVNTSLGQQESFGPPRDMMTQPEPPKDPPK